MILKAPDSARFTAGVSVAYMPPGFWVAVLPLGFRELAQLLWFCILAWPLIEHGVSGVLDTRVAPGRAWGFCWSCWAEDCSCFIKPPLILYVIVSLSQNFIAIMFILLIMLDNIDKIMNFI